MQKYGYLNHRIGDWIVLKLDCTDSSFRNNANDRTSADSFAQVIDILGRWREIYRLRFCFITNVFGEQIEKAYQSELHEMGGFFKGQIEKTTQAEGVLHIEGMMSESSNAQNSLTDQLIKATENMLAKDPYRKKIYMEITAKEIVAYEAEVEEFFRLFLRYRRRSTLIAVY